MSKTNEVTNGNIGEVKVSFIIPVYNASKYLRQCLNSLASQTMREIEIICVNDGSTDNSQEVLQEYAKKDSRFKIINQKNKGEFEARRTGINHATGKYIMFSDADDYFKKTAAQTAFDAVEKAGAAIGEFAFYTVRKFLKKQHKRPDLYITNEQLRKDYIGGAFGKSLGLLFPAVWEKIFKTTVLQAAVKGLPELRLHIAADLFLAAHACCQPDVDVLFISEPLYYHIARKDSIITSYAEKILEAEDIALPMKIKLAQDNNLPPSVIEDMMLERAYSFIILCKDTLEKEPQKAKEMFEEYFKHSCMQLARDYFKNADLENWDDMKHFAYDNTEQWYEFIERRPKSQAKSFIRKILDKMVN
ncbi:MAG: glycosyltransferase [Oscillospiraceae bacterium]|jgi:glycosyltransferase involved in cell wall biosynthesis|nr:glycosyltransferase [Oscillospiraceae bacterium]